MNSIRDTLEHPQFRRGAAEMSGVSLGIAAWGLVTGVAMVKSGLSMPMALMNWSAWQIPSIIGIVLADVIPTHWGLGFAGVLALLGLMYSLMSDKATAFAAVMAAGAAVAAFELPFRLYIVVAIAAAVCVGLLIDGGGDAGERVLARLRRRVGEPLNGKDRREEVAA